MRKLLVLSFFLLIYHFVFAQAEYVEATVSRNNTYALKYYSLFNKTDENLILSPFGVSTCMAMAYIGSEGTTQQVIAQHMNFITPFGILFGFKQLIKRYQIYKSSDINLQIGNALWSSNENDLLKKYKNLLKVNFAAHVENLSFSEDAENNSKLINRWAKKSSNYNVLSIIRPENIRKDDRLIFTNFVNLNGNWENPFDEQFTSKDDFYTSDSVKIKVDFMNQSSYLKYNENEIFKIIELPYSGQNISMIVLLPKKVSDIDSIEKSLNSVNFDFWINELYIKLVNVSIPKFRIDFLQDVSSTLIANGCELPFSDKANFSRIGKPPVHISRIIQKTSITVEENKNNNFTEQVISKDQNFKNIENSVMNFKADKPFIFIIVDNFNHSILLIGKVVSPNFNNLSAEFYNN